MLVLALPIVDFNNMSVKDQMARLHDGRTLAEDFDFTAFAFDFGPQGREVLEKLRTSEEPALANGAKLALAAEYRWNLTADLKHTKVTAFAQKQLKVLPIQVEVPVNLAKTIGKQGACLGNRCALFWNENSPTAQLISSSCDLPIDSAQNTSSCRPRLTRLKKNAHDWQLYYAAGSAISWPDIPKEQWADFWAALDTGQFEVRDVELQQLFIDGQAIGDPY